MAWKSGAPQDPRSVQEWINHLTRRLDDIEGYTGGRGEWHDVVAIGPNFKIFGAFPPGWRRLSDGRVELRGRVERKSGVACVDGDVLFTLPYECAPPNNEQQTPSRVAGVGVTENITGPGVVRIDIKRENTWKVDAEGNPVSVTEILVRPPNAIGFIGWIGLDHVIYDQRLYLDALAPVPYGQEPLVPETTIVVFEHPSGTLEVFPAGVQQPVGSIFRAEKAGDSSSNQFGNIRDPYRLLEPESPAGSRYGEKGDI